MPEKERDARFERDQIIRNMAKRSKHDEKFERARLYARRVLRAFNACVGRGRHPAFFPTIQCCVIAEQTRLETKCPGCGMITHSHVDKFDYHPLATVAMLLFKIKCGRCREDAPLPRITAINRLDEGSPSFPLSAGERVRRAIQKLAMPAEHQKLWTRHEFPGVVMRLKASYPGTFALAANQNK